MLDTIKSKQKGKYGKIKMYGPEELDIEGKKMEYDTGIT